MSESLNTKTAIVTGASRGIGKAIALSLAKSGVKVVLAARHQDDLETAKKEILKNGGECMIVQADVATEEHVDLLIKKTTDAFGTIDILVNNAGFGIFSKVAETSVKDFDGMMNVNLRGVFLCCKGVLPTMIRHKGGVSSILHL